MFTYIVFFGNTGTDPICKQELWQWRNIPCTDPGRFVRGSPTLTTLFLADEGKDDPNTTISGPYIESGLVALCFLGDLDQYC